MNQNRNHNRTEFYKYTSFSTALKIIENHSLRWGAPSTFNDPFDVPKVLHEDIDPVALDKACMERFASLFSGCPIEHPEQLNSMTKLLVEQVGGNERAKKLMIKESIKQKNNAPSESAIQELRELWKKTYEDNRILCLSERWDSSSMWDRYSDGHQGVVFELACIDEIDSPWLVAKKVRYTDLPLKSNTPEGLAEILLYENLFATRLIVEEYTYTKTTDWKYEKEWRIASNKRPNEIGSYSDYSIHPSNFRSVIIGKEMKDEDRHKLIKTSKKHLTEMRIKEAVVEKGRKLSIKELN